MILYNVSVVILSLFMFKDFLLGGWATSYTFGCVSCDFRSFDESPEAFYMARAVWFYYISKFVEFFDTFCFIVRKKNDQISLLHVIHHVTMPWWWLGIHFCPGGMGTFHAMLNSLVHCFMYSYYALAAADVRSWLWWKPYLTIMQISQFLFIIVHNGQLFFTSCSYRHQQVFRHMINFYAMLFTVLFCNFYVQAYFKRKRLAKPASPQQKSMEKNGHCEQHVLSKAGEKSVNLLKNGLGSLSTGLGENGQAYMRNAILIGNGVAAEN